MSNTLRSKIIRLAHQNPSLRPHLLPLLQEGRTAADHFEALHQPNTQTPVYKGNAMAVPLTWGSAGKMSPYQVAEAMFPLWENAKGGVAYVLDQNGVFAAAGIPAVEKALHNSIYSMYEEHYAYMVEAGGDNLQNEILLMKALQKLKVDITPITESGKAGLKVVFSPTVEQVHAIR
jgi:hypothetical protein